MQLPAIREEEERRSLIQDKEVKNLKRKSFPLQDIWQQFEKQEEEEGQELLEKAPEAELPGMDLDAAGNHQKDGKPGGEERIFLGNGDPLGKLPNSARSSKGDFNDLHDLRRQPSRSSLMSTFSQGVKDKFASVLPASFSKNPEQNKLRLLVCIMAAICVGMVITTHVFYIQHKGKVRIFDDVRLEEHHKDLLLYDSNNRLVTSGHLGRLLPESIHPYPCKPSENKQKGVKCLEWKQQARLEISQVAGGHSCHRIVWTSLSRDMTPRDCWPIGPGQGHWYGGGERLNTTWPLGDTATVRLTPFVTGDEAKTEWGNVIRKLWINSRGLTISVDDDSPLSVSINDPKVFDGDGHGGGHGLCLQASFDEFPYYYHRFNLPVLNYTVCTAPNLEQVYNATLDYNFWEGHTDTDINMLDSLIELPIWQVPSLSSQVTYTPERIEGYLNSLLGERRRARGQRGLILLDHHWQENMGDFTFSKSKFSKLRQAQDAVRAAGLKLALTISPFVSVDSPNFKRGVMEGLFVMERNSTSPRGTPALTWFKDVPVAALLDITNKKTVAWLRSKLRELGSGDASEAVFVLDTGNTFHTPHYFAFNQSLSNPDLYKEHFINEAMEEVTVVGVSGASSKRPKAPAFVWLSPLDSTWFSLQSIVPNILHLGVIGYPFVNPGPIGGTPVNSSVLPSPELYTRWWQLATFLPQLHFLTPPSAYASHNIGVVANKLKRIREEVVTPVLQKLSRDSIGLGRPLIRPLWMYSPNDEASQRISDQFMLGDDLLIAPVVKQGQTVRDVYLPPPPRGVGRWCSSDGKFHSGGQWLNSTKVPFDSVLYYRRKDVPEQGTNWSDLGSFCSV